MVSRRAGGVRDDRLCGLEDVAEMKDQRGVEIQATDFTATGEFWFQCDRCGAFAAVRWMVQDAGRVRLCAPGPHNCIICGGYMNSAANPNQNPFIE